jgi:choline kinase
MRGIILAAGRGSRLGSYTVDRPKGLVPLRGKGIMEWQLQAIRAAGIEEVAVVRGYQAERISLPSVSCFENPRWAETNMVQSLLCADRWLSETDCLVSYADIICRPEHVARLAACSFDLAITYDQDWHRLWSARFADPLSDAETFAVDDLGRLLEIGRKTDDLAEIQGQYMGLLKVTPGGWARIRRHLSSLPPALADRLDLTALLGRLLAEGETIGTVPVRGGWLEVDDARDLALYERLLEESAGYWLHELLEPSRGR